MATNDLFTNNNLDNPDLCAQQMGVQGARNFLCLLCLSLAAGDSSNPGIWELSPVYAYFYNKDLCPTYEAPWRASYVLQAAELKMDLESYKKADKPF